MARTRGRAFWAKGKKLWRAQGRLRHSCPRELRPRIARSLVSTQEARLHVARCEGHRMLVQLWRSETPLHDQPLDDGRRNRADPRLSPKSAASRRTAVVQTLAIRLLPVLCAWTDQAGSVRDGLRERSRLLEHVARAVQPLNSGDQIKHVALLGRGGVSAFAGGTIAAHWLPSGRVRPRMLATSPTSRQRLCRRSLAT
jgi:hypothetical protein